MIGQCKNEDTPTFKWKWKHMCDVSKLEIELKVDHLSF